MSSCRGVIISATTNTCRTLMAEHLLRHMSKGRLPIVSGGLDFSTPINSNVSAVLKEIGIEDQVGPSKGISKLLQQQGWTFDVMISFADSDPISVDPDLAPQSPNHWEVASDSGNVSRQWVVWSPRNPEIEHEDSVRKFQDSLYRGEPLFSTRTAHKFRSALKLSKRWYVAPISHRPMERPLEVLDRHREARDAIHAHCRTLLGEMEELYGEKLLVE